MKRLISLALVMTICLSLAACAPAVQQNTNTTESSTAGTTAPDITEPDATNPDLTEPDVTNPDVTEPEVTEPEVTEPEVTEPPVTEPEVTEPEVTEPEVTEPNVTEPEVTEPPVTEPEVTEPDGYKPPFKAEKPQQVNGVYQIYSPNHLLYVAVEPGASYALCNNIDLCGTLWKPIDSFTGSLTGLIGDEFNFKISNAVIQVAAGDTNVGFFRKVTGIIKELDFENITLTGTGVFTGNVGIVVGEATCQLTDVDARNCHLQMTVKDAYVGILAGKVTKAVSDCYTSGALNVTLAGGNSYVAGGIGYATQNVTALQAHANVTVTESAKSSGAVGGAVGYAGATVNNPTYGGHFKVNADVAVKAGALVGELAGKLTNGANCARSNVVNNTVVKNHYGVLTGTATESGSYYRDLSNIEDNMSDAEYAMRKQMVDYMYQMVSFVWRPTEDLHTACTKHGSCKVVYKAGEVYVGMPYTHEGGSYESFLTCLDENGNVKPGVAATRWYDLMGNDCIDATCWAWNLTSASIHFHETGDRVLDKGALIVGDFEITSKTNTKDIWSSNGKEKMYEALAQVKMGDCLFLRTEQWGGHARLAAESAYVFRDANGKVDPNKSYILLHEQGYTGGVFATRHSTCAVNKRYTFADLSNGYIPITTVEIQSSTPAKVEVSCTNMALDKTGLGKGEVVSNYRLNLVTVQITDANGSVVYSGVAHPFGGRAECKSYALETDFAKDLAALQLTSGAQYSYEVLVLVAGQQVTAQSFTFTG